MKPTTEHTLKVGETALLRRSIFSASISVIYAGMPSATAYSIVVKWAYGNQSLAYNLYFSDRQREIVLPKGVLVVINVSREKILFKYQP